MGSFYSNLIANSIIFGSSIVLHCFIGLRGLKQKEHFSGYINLYQIIENHIAELQTMFYRKSMYILKVWHKNIDLGHFWALITP